MSDDGAPIGRILVGIDGSKGSQAALRWAARLAQAGVHHRACVVDGRAGPALAQAARREQADLLVTGRRGLNGVAELVRGSVSHYLTHHAPCPLAVVPMPNGSSPS